MGTRKITKILLSLLSIIVILASMTISVSASNTTTESSQITLSRESLPQVLSYIDIENTEHIERLYTQETDNTTAKFRNNDGSITVYYFDQPIKYTDEYNIVRDKNITLTDNSDSFKVSDSDVKISMSKDLSGGVSVNISGYNISFLPVSEKIKITDYLFEEKKIVLADKIITDTNLKAEKSGNTVNYKNAFGASTLLEYIPQFSGIKENIILDKYTGQNEFNFIINTDGLYLISDEFGNFSLNDKDGNKIAILGQVILYDAKNNISYGETKSKTIINGKQYVVTLCVDMNFLTSSDTVYPVTVDPVVTKYYSNNSFEYIYLDSTNPTSNNLGAYRSKFLIQEYIVQNYSRRVLLRFPGLSNDTTFTSQYSTITSAYLDAWYHENHQLTAYTWTGSNWSTTTTTYNNLQTSLNVASATTAYFNGNSYDVYPKWTFDMTNITQQWKAGNDNNYLLNKGIIIRSTDFYLSYAEIYNSYNTAIGAGPMTLRITYDICGVYKIKNVATKKYLTTEGGCAAALNSTVVGHITNVMQNTLHSGIYSEGSNPPGSQQFRVVYRSDQNAYTLSPICSNNGRYLVLSVVDGIPRLEKYTGLTRQLFILTETASGSYTISPKSSSSQNFYAANDTDGSISLYSNESNLTVGIKTDNYAKWEFIPDTEYTSMENYYAGINFSFPLPNSSSSYNFDTGYGNRWWTSLNNNIPQRHMGMDICANSGTVLKSAANGEVVCIGNSSSGGNYIIIECSNIYVYNTNIKLRFAYFHMNQASSLNVGDNVTTNTVVGYVGNTGTSSEPHLHMAIITNGGNSATNYNYTIDPLLLYNGYSFNFIRK